MFIRTSSTLVSQAKSTLFRCNLQNSFLRGGARASICNASFSSMINFTAGYTFIPSIAEQTNFRGAMNVDLDHTAKTMLIGIGLDVAKFKFDGSGDSGDFELEEIKLTISNVSGSDKDVFNNIGVIDSYCQEHDVVMRQRRWTGRGWTSAGMNTCNELIEHLAYSSLEEQYGGWEINAGSSGYVTVDGHGEGIEIDIQAGTYYCDYCDTEYDDDTSCECIKCPDCYEPTEDGICENCETKLIKCKGIDGDKCIFSSDVTEENPVCSHCLFLKRSREEEHKAKETAQ